MSLSNWPRLLLAVLVAVIFMFSIPAYFNTSANPALALLSGEAASIGSTAGAFLGRQMTIALLALLAVIWGNREAMIMGALGMVLFNLHDAVFLTLFGAGGAGAIAGIVIAVLGVAVIFGVRKPS